MKAFVFVAVPPGVIKTTFFKPIVAPAGVTAVTEVAETTVKLVAATPPIVTLDVPVKFVPVMVIVVPPANIPVLGFIVVIVGTKLKKSLIKTSVLSGILKYLASSIILSLTTFSSGLLKNKTLLKSSRILIFISWIRLV